MLSWHLERRLANPELPLHPPEAYARESSNAARSEAKRDEYAAMKNSLNPGARAKDRMAAAYLVLKVISR